MWKDARERTKDCTAFRAKEADEVVCAKDARAVSPPDVLWYRKDDAAAVES